MKDNIIPESIATSFFSVNSLANTYKSGAEKLEIIAVISKADSVETPNNMKERDNKSEYPR